MTRIAVAHLGRGREWRGGERQVCLLATELAGDGEVTQQVMTRRGSALAAAARGLTVRPLSWSFAWDPRALAGTVSGLKALASVHPGPTVLHAHDSHALALALAAGALLHLPVVATRRSTSPPGPLWNRPAMVIAISDAVAAALSPRVPPGRIRVIPSGIPLSLLRAVPRPSEPGPPTILAVGALTREKGHDVLLRALAAGPLQAMPARLTILCEGPERRGLRSLAESLGIADRVAMPGAVASAWTAIAAASVLVMPSRREGLGTAALEAMALGTPVVGTSVGGLAGLLGDGAGLLVPPDDPEGLAAALGTVLGDPRTRRRLAETARNHVEQYDISRLADRVVAVYRSALRIP